MDKFYTHSEEIHNTRSAEIVVPLILNLIQARSVLDVGCGTGTWLKIFNEKFGLTDFLGLDGSYINYNQLVVDRSHFKEIDLRKSFDLQRKFDLVLCLEVAEHLPEASADDLIASLCRHGNTILFSAAIPGQGGQNHFNEQWIDYWEVRFNKHNCLLFDAIRPKIWLEENVDVWYRQNLFVFAKQNELNITDRAVQMAEIHPELWRIKIEALKRLSEEVTGFDQGKAGILRSFRALFNAVGNKFRSK